MGFWGKSFVFDDIPCENYDLMVYDLGESDQQSTDIAGVATIIEEVVPGRMRPLFLGTKREKKLEMTMVFGVNLNRIDESRYLDRYELDAVGNWLTGHDTYKYLAIEQDDMEIFRYRCIVTSLSVVTYGNLPWALRATFTCDGPYAYRPPMEFQYDISGSQSINFFCDSSAVKYYYPVIEITALSGNSVQIVNTSDDGRIFSFSNLPSIGSSATITIDNENRVITCDNDQNMYPYFNFKFFRLVPGHNQLTVTGTCLLTIRCELPVNIGG